MTSRPGGSQRQPPQRSLSSANLIQRPPPQRTLSQQFPPASPVRRANEGFADSAIDGSDGAALGGRYGTIPRNGGSRLKLEVSTDSQSPGLVESPKPTSDATPAWRPTVPPRGRPQLHFDVPSVSHLRPRAAQESGHISVPPKSMPLPVRPGQHKSPATEKSRSAPASSAKKDARPKPYTLEVPTAAPRYSPNGQSGSAICETLYKLLLTPEGHADFFPWTGNHPEDQFSETAIRQGFFDKAQMTQNEMGSAKASIFPALKHKSGMQALSSLFTSVLAQRRAHGQITTSSTFKPPPRVTVTDTKREMWLKDLANPTIPLRRLSRSIPHGIRGKVLLDQSLSKNIPIERAVWLAKCVGANELRSFRRKGASGTFAMGGEAKWIRDFTVCVEQFLENIVSSCGEKDFKSRINYAIRLAAHFHAEYLLDREHYMDWLVSSLENSQQAKLPMWLLITQIYWKDLLKYRKHGRRLAAALVNHLTETLGHPDHDVLAPLNERLQLLIKGLLVSNPESFISPKEWAQQRITLKPWLTSESTGLAGTYHSIDERNSRFADPSAENNLSTRRRLIHLLDSTISKPFDYGLSRTCWEVVKDKSLIMQTVLEWCTSSHRPGHAKIYVATRILRFCSKSDADVSEAVLNFLDSKVCDTSRNKPAFYHLVSELARSEHFSTPNYLQWLISRGGIYNLADVSEEGPCATRLLAELPTHNLSENMVELRRTLLDRAGFSIDVEEDQTNAYMSLVEKSLPGMQASSDLDLDLDFDSASGLNFDDLFAKLSRSSKSEVGLWLRQKVRDSLLQSTLPLLDEWESSLPKERTTAITAPEFNIIRTCLERAEDFSMLADVLKLVTSSSDPDVLASCADTLDLHMDTFAAIGALSGLFDTLVARLRSLTDETGSTTRVFLVSLSDLAARMPEQKLVAQQLAYELDLSDRKTAADACSPVSDHMALMESAEADFTDEIERVLASGNSMDQSTLESLFQRIAVRLEESWMKLPEQHRSCGLLFTRLRTFDAQQFDRLMSNWVNHFQVLPDRPSMMHVLGPLISFGCLTIQEVVLNGLTVLEKLGGKDPAREAIARELLSLAVIPSSLPEVMTAEEAYRLRIKQSHLQKDYPLETLNLIRQVLENPDKTLIKSVHDPSSIIYGVLQRLTLLDTESMTKSLVLPLLQTGNEHTAVTILSIVDRFLVSEEYDPGAKSIAIEAVLKLADDFTLPFCQVKLASMFALEDTAMQDTEEDRSERLEALDNAIETAVSAQNTSWTCIVPLLDISIAQHVRKRAERQLLAVFSTMKATNNEFSMQNRTKQAENLLYIIEATAYSTDVSTTTSIGPEIVTPLSNLWHLLSNTQNTETKELLITKWIPLLLSFITVQASIFEVTKSGYETRAKVTLGLTALLLELQALDTTKEAVVILIEQTFDLALYLVDALSDDVRQQCIRSLRDTVSNPRVSYLFSIVANPSEWLVLSQKEKVISVPPDLNASEPRAMAGAEKEKITPFVLRRWEMLGEPTPNIGENDTSLSLTLFGARRG